MLKWGLAYVPQWCKGEAGRSCRIHVNYHGCISGKAWIKRQLWATSLDLNEYAEANSIIVLYPQTAGSKAAGDGCWNWISYKNDPWFDTRWGLQLGTVANLLIDLPNALQNAQVFTGGKMPADVSNETSLAAPLQASPLPSDGR